MTDITLVTHAVTQTRNALNRLDEAIGEPLDSHAFMLDATLQRFEYSYEMLWKTLRKLFALKHIRVSNAWDAFKEAYAQQLISDKVLWKRIIEDRNRTVHHYSNEDATAIYHRVCDEYFLAMTALLDVIERELQHEFVG